MLESVSPPFSSEELFRMNFLTLHKFEALSNRVIVLPKVRSKPKKPVLKQKEEPPLMQKSSGGDQSQFGHYSATVMPRYLRNSLAQGSRSAIKEALMRRKPTEDDLKEETTLKAFEYL